MKKISKATGGVKINYLRGNIDNTSHQNNAIQRQWNYFSEELKEKKNLESRENIFQNKNDIKIFSDKPKPKKSVVPDLDYNKY